MKILSCGLLLAILLAGCQAQPRGPVDEYLTRAPTDQPAPWPESARHYLIDGQASKLRIVVMPAGTLARFGHPHVIGGPVLAGEIALAEPFSDSALRLTIDVNQLVVDKPDWRIAEGFDPELPESAIADTRENMLSAAVLDAASHPSILIESTGLTGPPWQSDIALRVSLRGVARELTVPVAVSVSEHELVATGRLVLNQSDFGIEPFSALGGALAVADRLMIRFRIVAFEE